MSIFKYTLASGDRFTLRAPTGTTQGQADAIFYSQVAAGSLVGYIPGQTLSSSLTNITKFQLSRLDRGTAGVDEIAVLASVAGFPSISTASTLALSSINTGLSNPVNAGNVLGITTDGTGYNNGSNLNAPAIGPLSPAQVQAVQAQIINFVNQPSNSIITPGTFNTYTNITGTGLGTGIVNNSANVVGNNVIGSRNLGGLGQYGLTATHLEQAGYLKPGTSYSITDGNESITGPTTFPVNYDTLYYYVTGVPGTTFSWQSAGGWYKAPTDPTWCAFMDSYAVWVGNPQEITTNVYSTNINFPVTGTYTFNISTDNSGSISVDGVGTFSWADFHTVGTQTATVTAGIHLVTLSITNYGGPAGIAAQIIKPDASELWNTLSIISDSINPNGFTRGGPFTFDGEGTIPPIPSSYDIPGTYFYDAFFSTGHTFTWTNFITYDGPVGPNYIERTPGNFVQVLGAPGVWTGKDGINSLNDMLASPLIQNIAQTTLMQNAYDNLTSTGVIIPPVTQPSISQGQVYTQGGLQQLSTVSLAINAAFSVPGSVQSGLSNSPIIALTSTPTNVTSTLVNGAINDFNRGAYALVTDNSSAVNRAVTGTAASLIATTSKFGTVAVNNWITGAAQSVGLSPTVSNYVNSTINRTINQVTNQVINSATSTVKGLLNGTISTDQISSLAKSSDFAAISSDPSAAFDNLTSKIGDNLSTSVDSLISKGNNILDNITSGNFSLDPTSFLSGPGLGLAEKALGIKGNDARNLNTAIQIGTAIGTSLLTNSSVLNGISSIFGGSGTGALTSLTNVPGLGSVVGAFMGGGGLAGQTKIAAGFSNTVNRSTLDAAVVKILGSNKIPNPIYVLPTARSQAAATNVAQAQSFLSNSPGGGSAVDISAGLASGQLNPAQVRDAVLAQRAAQNPPSNYNDS